jgi:histidinol-phosphatase
VTNWSTELEFAEHLAELADRISMKHFRDSSTAVRTKRDGTPVTEADEAIERALREEIAGAYPDHGILGEEEGETGTGAGRRWILDPIDGTKNFSWGIPNWGTLIALEVDGEIVCGVASAPALGDRWRATRGGGAYRNDQRLEVSAVDSLADARVGFTSAAELLKGELGPAFDRLLRTAAHDRGIGDFLGHMLVAAGSLDLMIEPILSAWDLGPLIVIVEEAGGRFTDTAGNRTIYGRSALSTNGLLHDDLLNALRRDGTA